MAFQFSTALRNARRDSIEGTIGASPVLEIRSGAKPANCAAADTGTVLATMALPVDWLSGTDDGVAALLGTWEDPSGDADGVAGHFRLKQGSICHIQGTITKSGNGGDMELVNTNIAVGQPVSLNTFTITEGNA